MEPPNGHNDIDYSEYNAEPPNGHNDIDNSEYNAEPPNGHNDIDNPEYNAKPPNHRRADLIDFYGSQRTCLIIYIDHCDGRRLGTQKIESP